MAPPSSAELPLNRLPRTVTGAKRLKLSMPPPSPTTWKVPMLNPVAELPEKALLIRVTAAVMNVATPVLAELALNVEPLTVIRSLALSMAPPRPEAELPVKVLPLMVVGHDG